MNHPVKIGKIPCVPPNYLSVSIVSEKARNTIYEKLLKTGFFRFSGEPVTVSGFFTV